MCALFMLSALLVWVRALFHVFCLSAHTPSCVGTADFDPTNTTLFIGGLSGGVTEEQLRAAFARFGDIIYVKIPAVSSQPVGCVSGNRRAGRNGSMFLCCEACLRLQNRTGQQHVKEESCSLACHLASPTVQGKGCGFVQFVLRTAAERAMGTMNGQVLGAGAMRISWGRSSSRVANQAAQQGGMGGHFGMHGECEFKEGGACTRRG